MPPRTSNDRYPSRFSCPIDLDILKQAMTTFKKRLKLTILNDESRLGCGRPTTGGTKSEVSGIQPPSQFPRAVWQELARQGKIKDLGGGFYGGV